MIFTLPIEKLDAKREKLSVNKHETINFPSRERVGSTNFHRRINSNILNYDGIDRSNWPYVHWNQFIGLRNIHDLCPRIREIGLIAMNAEKRTAREVSSSRDLIERNDRLCPFTVIELQGKGIRRRRRKKERKREREKKEIRVRVDRSSAIYPLRQFSSIAQGSSPRITLATLSKWKGLLGYPKSSRVESSDWNRFRNWIFLIKLIDDRLRKLKFKK